MADKPATTKTTDGKTIKLMDGTEISVRPLKLSLLRPFMTKFALLADASEDNDKSMDILIDCAQIALKQFKPELAEDREVLEDLLDLPTVYQIIDAASGLQNSDSLALTNVLNK
jgi:hypothetical protein